jgi:glycosyltransferase involved in cell wall biosynthesis
VLALAAATQAPFAPIVGSLQRPWAMDSLGAEARRRGLRALRFESAARFDLACARAVARAGRAEGVQLLHAHDFKSLFIAVAAGAMARVPAVMTYHGDTASTWQVRGYETFARALGNLTRGVAGVSRSLEEQLERWVHLAPVAFVPNGLPLPAPVSGEERAKARDRFGVRELCLAVIGRLSPEKGHRILFQAARGLPATLLVAGDGPLRAELEQAARGVDVRFLGYLEDARDVFASADVIALPSLTEGLPLTALEALSLGRCLVASAVGGLPELLSGGAGVLVPPGDAAALARALEQVRSPEQRAPYLERGLRRARDYDVAAMASSYAGLYSRALSLEAMPSSSR